MSIRLLIILLIFFGFESSMAQSIVLIQFELNDEDESISELVEIEDRLQNELVEMEFEVSKISKSTWEVERSNKEKKNLVVIVEESQYSIELKYASTSEEIYLEIKNWNLPDSEIRKQPKKISAGRLTNYPTNQERTALGIEWSRDIDYFIKNNEVLRPEIGIEEFISDQDNENTKTEELIAFLRKNMQLIYLTEEISRCFKLKDFDMFDECINMRAHYTSNSDALNLTIEFEDPAGGISEFKHGPSSIPNNESGYRRFTKQLLSLIEWPENVQCHE